MGAREESAGAGHIGSGDLDWVQVAVAVVVASGLVALVSFVAPFSRVATGLAVAAVVAIEVASERLGSSPIAYEDEAIPLPADLLASPAGTLSPPGLRQPGTTGFENLIDLKDFPLDPSEVWQERQCALCGSHVVYVRQVYTCSVCGWEESLATGDRWPDVLIDPRLRAEVGGHGS